MKRLLSLLCLLLVSAPPVRCQLAQSVTAVPTLNIQPASQNADYGSDVSFVAGTKTSPVRYQWRKDGVDLADYENVAGSHEAQIYLVGVGQRDEGEYSVVVSNAVGLVTSVVARLTLNFATVFSDDFEAGTTNWTAFSELPTVASAVQQYSMLGKKSGSTPEYMKTLSALNLDGLSYKATRLAATSNQNHTLNGGTSAQVKRPRDKMFHNLGTKLAGRVQATFWIYDNGETNECYYGELRGYTGPGHAVYYQPAGLRQLLAIGRFDIGPSEKVTGGLPDRRVNKWAEKPDRSKYQGKIERGKATGSGWFNLSAPGAPDRSVGWHKFQIVRGADGTTVDFIIDGVLGRRMSGANNVLIDCVTIGSTGAGGGQVAAYFDDVKVEAVPWRYDWQSKDTVGKGLFDWMQLRETGIDPQVTDIRAVSNAFQVNGSSAIARWGQWENKAAVASAKLERGVLDYVVQAPAPDAYRIEIEARPFSDNGSPFDSWIVVSIDSEYLGRFLLPYNSRTNGFVRCFTPYLNAGPHTIRAYWDGARNHASISVAAVRLQALAGADANQNRVKDWVETRLLSQSGVEIAPAASLVSPAFVEGRGKYLTMMQILYGTSTGKLQPVQAQPGAGYRWFANIPLNSDAQTHVQVAYENGSFWEAHDIAWRVTNLLEADDATIRQGDALLFTVAPAGITNGPITVSVVGATDYVSDVAKPVAHRFEQPGTYSVMGTYRGKRTVTRIITVRVIGASLGGPIAAWVTHRRFWDLPAFGNEVVLDADPRLKLSELADAAWQTQRPAPPPLASGSRRYSMLIDAAEPRVVVARLGAGGPILASTVVQGFRLFATYDTYLRYVSLYPDGSQMLEGAFVVSPRSVLDQGVTVDLDLFVSGSTFADGTLRKTLSAADFDELGICRVKFIRAAKVATTVCHTTRAFQGGMSLGRPSYEK